MAVLPQNYFNATEVIILKNKTRILSAKNRQKNENTSAWV